MEDLRIRVAKPEDAEELLDIYAPYVTGTAITFEYEVPSVEEFRARITHVLEKYPYLYGRCRALSDIGMSGCTRKKSDS